MEKTDDAKHCTRFRMLLGYSHRAAFVARPTRGCQSKEVFLHHFPNIPSPTMQNGAS